ncbi:MAG: tetratricopeptide repeat protein [Ferruginibacter sp.]|nr:tetratricopeptide repeat protein [Ferruginibacter sp.]
MKKIIVTLLLFYTCPAVFSQRAIDSLIKLAATTKDDSVRVTALLGLNREYLSDNPAEAIRYALEAKLLSEKIHYAKGRAYSYKGLGLVYIMQGKYLEAIENYEQSLFIFDSLHDKPGVANILSNEGTVYYNQADDAKALELYLKALNVAEQTTDSQRIATILLNIGAVYSNKFATHNLALDYYFKALKLGKSLQDNAIVGTTNANIGEIYFTRNEDEQALKYFKESLKDYEGTENFPFALNNLGKVYLKKRAFITAIQYHQQAFEYAKKLDASLDMAQSLLGLGDTYMKQENSSQAIKYYKEAEPIALQISNANNELKSTYAGLALAYAAQADFSNAYKYESLLTNVKDSIYNTDTDKKITGLQLKFDIQKKQAEVDLLIKNREVQELQLKRQRATRNILLAGLSIAFIFALVLYRNYRNKIKINKVLNSQKQEIETLLLNILPADVAQELQKNGFATARYYEKASVLFTDIKSFSKLADELSPQEVVTELNDCFVAFDDIIGKYNLEKIKTIGDSYMCAGGIPLADDAHIINIVKASLEIQEFIKDRNAIRMQTNLPPWDIRIGINTGPIVAGVVGKKKYAYDIWGGTVNVASRMESNGEPGRVNISAATYELIKDQYACTYRGKIFAKNIGEIDMYFVDGALN